VEPNDGNGDRPPPSLEEIDARLRQARRDANLEAESTAQRMDGASGNGDLGLGLRIAVELVAGVAVGLGAGLLLDRWLGTAPWGLIGMLFLGSIAGFMNVYRVATGAGYAAGHRRSRRKPDGEERGRRG